MSADRPVGRAAFLGGLLAFITLIELSVVGLGHARSLRGDANIQYWAVVAIVVAAAATVLFNLARTPAATKTGELVRRVAVPVAAIGLAIFLWETVALGVGASSSPLELIAGAFR
ncbi:hypothetical protein [Hansschlegelia beijingensis]|uniref:Protein-S-isoprenylcysteine O-methyltransferase Ste14 n=1 Tax=Hansschlegelia beijingensis TaxID=1133344 RepID=A0A7W6GEN1_9HYPH|nr:hypothetical protein [Hansschlegelia beijingensis]MBB3972380.1 protein-S-isoprenylcysteine O-methyltransferase Ste14 [Hansschlegelia beijingensis]